MKLKSEIVLLSISAYPVLICTPLWSCVMVLLKPQKNLFVRRML